MCGRLKHEKVVYQIGNVLPIQGETNNFLGTWLGHSREETLEKWITGGWKEGSLRVTEFTEGHPPTGPVSYNIPRDKEIKIIYRDDKLVKGGRPFNIVTREAIGNERIVHNRFPKLLTRKI